MAIPAEGTRIDAGAGGDLADELGADPQALRDYIAQRDAEVALLRRHVGDLERFRVLTLDVVGSLADAGRRAGQGDG